MDEQGFAALLRRLRSEAGSPMFRTIVARSGSDLSISALSKTFAGTSRPSWPTVQAIVRGLGLDPDSYRAAYNEAFPVGVRARTPPRVNPDEVADLLRQLIVEVVGVRAEIVLLRNDVGRLQDAQRSAPDNAVAQSPDYYVPGRVGTSSA